MKISVCHLYPDLMNLYGDRGNIIAFTRRCQWHGIETKIQSVTLNQVVDFAEFDFIFMGGGQDREQQAICYDFQQVKGTSLAEAVEAGVALLGICGAYQLLGRYYKTGEGEELPGLQILDVWTEAGDRRMIGNIVEESDLFPGRAKTLVGFENHSGRTFLGPKVRPLGRVLVGYGNNGEDGTEGAAYRHAIGTYLHGSALPKNPWLTDLLIAWSLERRYGAVTLSELDDEIEERAHQAAQRRAQETWGKIKAGVK
ncbi:MAG: glutamine amidotransferase [Firmicutes bacterium]|nr:glutamine amidotransferase [Bacillota bacterium]MCL5039186.1 glutamine amidotransferase [Bacillota bacterium]